MPGTAAAAAEIAATTTKPVAVHDEPLSVIIAGGGGVPTTTLTNNEKVGTVVVPSHTTTTLREYSDESSPTPEISNYICNSSHVFSGESVPQPPNYRRTANLINHNDTTSSTLTLLRREQQLQKRLSVTKAAESSCQPVNTTTSSDFGDQKERGEESLEQCAWTESSSSGSTATPFSPLCSTTSGNDKQPQDGIVVENDGSWPIESLVNGESMQQKLGAAAAASHEDGDDDDDYYTETSYMNEEEEEALQRMLSQQQDFPSTSLILSDNLANLTDDVLDMIQTNPLLQVLHLDHVQPRLGANHPHDNDDEFGFQEEGEPPSRGERGRGVLLRGRENPSEEEEEDAPELSSESSHTSATMILEQLEESLAVNTSLTSVAIVACHPKVMETVLWGLSCVPNNLTHLALEMWTHQQGQQPQDPLRRTRYLIWEGLVEILKNPASTLESLYIGNCHGVMDDVTAMNWPLLAQGLAQNTSLISLSIETLSWTEEATTLLSDALCRHPHLARADFVFENDHSTLVTIRPPKAPVAGATSHDSSALLASQVRVVEDSTNQDDKNTACITSRRLKAVVSADDMSLTAAAAATKDTDGPRSC
ncbi:hypothetical protein ACA910_010583 [Epithemia clementina (nom. ined.)]